MTGLHNKSILLGVSGGIAAYKSAWLARLLIKAGAQVRVVMTQGASAFIQPLTFQAITGHPVHQQLLDTDAEAGMGHIELARWADAILIAPCSANLMARLAQGQANDLLTTLCLATQAPIYLAPAMNQQMWAHPATQANHQTLLSYGYQLLTPESGEQACGDIGPGRLPEPETLCAWLTQALDATQKSRLAQGLRFLITAGPTQEAIDPVRYLSNHSSGKMGYALAAAAASLGAEVDLVSGPVHLPAPAGVTRHSVTCAEEMLSTCQALQPHTQIFIACAAVADYRAAEVARHKMKKGQNEEPLTLTLVRNPDILATLAQDNPRLYCAGFAAETQQVETHAEQKLRRKGLQAIIANDVSDPQIGFGSEENQVTLLLKKGELTQTLTYPKMSKTQLSLVLIQQLLQHYQETFLHEQTPDQG